MVVTTLAFVYFIFSLSDPTTEWLLKVLDLTYGLAERLRPLRPYYRVVVESPQLDVATARNLCADFVVLVQDRI